jgi:hypothetical protein
VKSPLAYSPSPPDWALAFPIKTVDKENIKASYIDTILVSFIFKESLTKALELRK